MTVPIRELAEGDREYVLKLLKDAHLSADGVAGAGGRYWVAEDGSSRMVGVIGLETGAGAALLRSAVVVPHARGEGIGARLTQHAIAWAAENGYSKVYCFSTDAGPYWQRFGFAKCSVDELVAALPDAPQVQEFSRRGWLPSEVAWRLDL